MNFVEQRAYIKGRTALNQTATSIHAELILIHGESAYKFRSVCKWVECFKAGRDEIEDKPRSGRPITELTEANISLVEQLIGNDKRISYSDLEELTSLSRGTLERIIREKLCLKKRSSRWIPHKLSIENKQKRLDFAKAMLNKFIRSNGVIEIDHPPYSPDLAPSDFWLFDIIKQHLGDQQDD